MRRLVAKTVCFSKHWPAYRVVNRVLDSIEHRLAEALEQAKDNGELNPGVDCKRLARLTQAQIIGLRSFHSETSGISMWSSLARIWHAFWTATHFNLAPGLL